MLRYLTCFGACLAAFAFAIPARSDEPSVLQLIDQGMKNQKAGRLDEAAAIYTTALAKQLSPEQGAIIHLNLGTLHAQRQQWDDAIRHYNEALKLGRRDAYVFGSRAAVYKAQGKYPESERDYLEAIRFAPKDVNYYIGLGNCRGGGAGNWDGAIVAYSDALQLDPKNADAYNYRGYAYAQKKKWDQAIQDQTEALRINPRYAVAYANRGDAYRAKGELEAALRDLNEAVKLDGSQAKIFNLRAVIYAAKGDWTQCVTDIDEAIRLDPKSDNQYANRGLARVNLRQSKQALQDFEEALRRNPKNALAHKGKAMLYLNEKAWAKLLPELEETLRSDPTDLDTCESLANLFHSCPEVSVRNDEKALTYARRACEMTQWKDLDSLIALDDLAAKVGQRELRAQALEKALKLPNLSQSKKEELEARLAMAKAPENGHSVDSVKTRSMELLTNGRIEEGLDLIRDEIKSQRPATEKAQLHILIGRVYTKLRRWDKVFDACDDAQRCDPKLADAYTLRAGVYLFQDKTQLALDNLASAIQLTPDDAALHSTRGIVYFNLHQWALAMPELTTAIRLDPKNAQNYDYRGRSRGLMEDFRGAIQDLDLALQLNPNLPEAYYNRGYAHTFLKEWDPAIKDLDKAIELNANFADSYAVRGKVYGERKDFQGALRDLDHAIQLKSTDGSYYQLRATTKVSLGDLDGANRDLAEVLRLDPNNAAAHKGLADIAVAQTRLDDAIRESTEAIRLNPTWSEAYKIRGTAYSYQSAWKNASTDFSKTLELNSEDSDIAIKEAFILASCPDAAIRQGAKAVAVARKACELTQWKSPLALDALGAAHAEAGDFEAATRDAQQALALSSLPEPMQKQLKKHLDLYAQRQPVHADTTEVAVAKIETVAELMARGALAQAGGNLDVAIICYQQALKRDPNKKLEQLLYNNLAMAYLSADKFEEAIKAADTALRLAPSNVTPLGVRGIAYGALGDFEKSARNLDAALDRTPHDAALHRQRSALYVALGDYASAILELNEAIRLYLANPPKSKAPIPVDHKSALEINLQEVGYARAYTPNLSNSYVLRGTAYAGETKWDLAFRDYNDALKIWPMNAQALAGRASAYGKTNDFPHASEDAAAALKLDPKNAVAHVVQGVLAATKGDMEEAHRDFDRAVEAEPKNSIGYLNRMGYWATKGDWAHALADAETAAPLAPRDSYLWSRIAGILAAVPDDALRNGAKALEAGKKACELTHWKDADCLDVLAMAEAEVGDFDQAIQRLQQALAVDNLPDERREVFQGRLKLYQDHKPYRLKVKVQLRTNDQ